MTELEEKLARLAELEELVKVEERRQKEIAKVEKLQQKLQQKLIERDNAKVDKTKNLVESLELQLAELKKANDEREKQIEINRKNGHIKRVETFSRHVAERHTEEKRKHDELVAEQVERILKIKEECKKEYESAVKLCASRHAEAKMNLCDIAIRQLHGEEIGASGRSTKFTVKHSNPEFFGSIYIPIVGLIRQYQSPAKLLHCKKK